jgi:hydroxymethylglutaryl-CoA lyase
MFAPVVRRASEAGLRVRGYVSTVLGCPFQGAVPHADVARVTTALFDLGVAEVSLGDTIGVGTAGQVHDLLEALAPIADMALLAVHMHDTYGQGLANTLAAFEAGVTIADTSIGGLGGCPFAPGATGNLATEDLVWALERSGVETGVNLSALVDTSAWMFERLGRALVSRAAKAILSNGMPISLIHLATEKASELGGIGGYIQRTSSVVQDCTRRPDSGAGQVNRRRGRIAQSL